MINFLISPEAEFETEDVKRLVQSQKVIYALSTGSSFDLNALIKTAKQNNFSQPKKNKKNFFQLKGAKRLFPWQKPRRRSPRELHQIASDSKSVDKIIIPVDVFWGKAPERQDHWVKLIFRDSWEAGSFLRNLLKVIFNGRQASVFFHKPLETEDIFSQKRSSAHLVLKTDRLLRARFRKNRQAKIGPDISNKRTLIHAILNSSSVKQEIKLSSNGSKKLENNEKKKAYKYALEICSDISYPVIYLYDKALNWFWNSRYDGLEILGIEKINDLAVENSLIYTPSHRSHIDYLALSYELYTNNLMLPQIVAGKNLNLPFLGRILRNGGAFFMRRSFGPNRLYSKVFFEHLRKLFQRGYSIEFFPEGGRTRTGRLLTPRPGIISMIIKSFQDMDERNVKFLPISINYEKVLEGKSHLKESRGQKKKKENLSSIFSTISDFRSYLGNAYLQFGEPIDLKSFLDKHAPNWQKDLIDLSEDTDKKSWLFEVTPLLGNKIMTNINKATVVTSSSLFASSISDISDKEIDKKRLSFRIEVLKKVIETAKYSELIKLPNITSDEIIQKVKKLKFYKYDKPKVLKISKNEKSLMEFYKNNILHLLILQAYVMYKSRKKIIKNDLINDFLEIFPQIKKDFFIEISLSNAEKKICNILENLKKINLLKIDSNSEISWSDNEKEKDAAGMFASLWLESFSAN
tara:strand:+ start:123 stop:2192 length:2070 start_codon:yes stop_codon:yes gene_type:complete